MKTFGEKIRAWRVHKGFATMADACRSEHIPYRTWQDWERGIKVPRGFALMQWEKRFERIKNNEQ